MENRKVSIIVPVYNAEQYLGYTLTSIIRQTYKNIEIILVNDGSSDGSLQICKNYEKIDKRIKVIDIVNSGVSSARNRGIEEATGEYIQFVDSDDYISEVMTERLVDTMEMYQSDLVVCGMCHVLLDGDKIMDREDWLPRYLGQECVLSKEIFMNDFSAILLYTVLLEGPCNKLYKKSFFGEYDLRFPIDKELGEDFLLNMHYFSEMENIAFISDVLYFYLQRHQESLSQQYRKNIFNNQMELLSNYEFFLKKNHVWKENNIQYFYQYAVGHIVRCLKSLFDERNVMSSKDIKIRLYEILHDDRAREWIQMTPWIDDEFEWLRECAKTVDIGTSYDKLKLLSEKKNLNGNEKKPGKFNKVIVCILKIINKRCRKKRIEKAIKSIENEGIKITLFKIKEYLKK